MSSERRIWGSVPAGFRTKVRGSNIKMIVRDDVASFLDPDLCARDVRAEEVSRFRGRGALRTISLMNGETAVVRPYRHGGVFRYLTGRIFCSWPPRPFRELAVTEELRRRGFPTVEVYGACVQAVFGPFYRGWLITRELRGARDLWEALSSQNGRAGSCEALLRPVAAVLQALHAQGVYHRDLNLKNILIREQSGATQAYVIDFDRAVLFLGPVPKPLAERNLARLLRSIRKLDPERKYVSREAWEEFLARYRSAHAEA